MPNRGGSGGITGYDYQVWFIAYQISKLIFHENLTIHPEAKIIHEPNFDVSGNIVGTQPKINFIEDVIVYENKIPSVYNIKYLAPDDSTWTVNRLINESVIKDLLQQKKYFPENKIVFVSQSSCPLLNDIFKRVRSLSSKKEIELTLNQQQNKDWTKLKAYTKLNDKQLIKFAQSIYFERGYEIEKYKELILSFSKGKLDNSDQVPLSLYALAVESCKESKAVSVKDFIGWLEKNNIRVISKMKITNLLIESKKVSISLINWNNIFGQITSSHLRRSEVDKILNWINLPTSGEKRPILTLTGKSGCGKSVIMRDVIEELNERNVSCIGLKVDLYNASNFNELNSQLNLDENIEKLINSLVASGKLVIILDQLDSLSLSLSSSRKSLNFYFDLINRISIIPGIKIIISCRSYDLSFDPSLKILEKEDKIEVTELSSQELDNVLQNLSLNYKILPAKLARLLSNAQHLNIFCTIYDQNVKLEEIKSIQDLYNELWQKKILNNVIGVQNLILLVKGIVKAMSTDQKLSVPKIIFQDKYSTEMDYLLSEGIINQDRKLLQFFHQTFFDYCFARFFVLDNKNLVKYVLNIHQGLFIRSTIKHVLAYLKSVKPTEYLDAVSQLLKSSKVRFHIKFLILNIIGSDDEPLDEEWEIVRKFVLKNKNLRQFFLESVTNPYWFNKLKINGCLIKYMGSRDELLRKSCESMCYRLIETEPSPILEFLVNSSEYKNKKPIIRTSLIYLKDWNNKESIELLESTSDEYDNYYSFQLSSILEKAFKYHKIRVATFLKQYIEKKINYYTTNDLHRDSIYGHEMEEILNKFYMADSDLFIETILPLVRKLAYNTKFEWGTNFFVDKAFYGYRPNDSLYSHWKLMGNLIDFVEKSACNDSAKFTKVIIPLKDEKSLTLISILLSGLLVNPTNYLDSIFDILASSDFLKEYNLDSGVSYKVHKLINISYENFSPSQKIEFNKLILLSECEILKKGEKREWKGYHIYNLLNALPTKELKLFSELQKKYLELQRKFGVSVIDKPHKPEGGSVGPPLPNIAYERMTLDNWLTSFKEYNESTGWDSHFHNKRGIRFGGLVEHSRAFGIAVKNDTEKYFPFIEKILNDEIAPDYISGGLLGLVEANHNPQKVASLVKKINSNEKSKKIRKSILQAVEYLDKVICLDRELFKIIEDYILNDPDPADEIWQVNAERNVPYYGGDPLTAGINSIRGSAVFLLVRLRNSSAFINEIFDILEKVSLDKSLAVRCSAIVNLNVLIRFDEERVFKIFWMFTKDKNQHILRNSLNCLSFYSKK